MSARAEDIAFREGVHGGTLNDVETSTLEALDTQTTTLKEQRDEARTAAEAAAAQLSAAALELESIAERYALLHEDISNSGRREYQGREPNPYVAGAGAITFLLAWWAIVALLAPLMASGAIAEQVRVTVALVCMAGLMTLLLTYVRHHRRKTPDFDVKWPGGPTYWRCVAVAVTLAGYQVFFPGHAWVFVLLLLVALFATVVSWSPLRLRQTGYMGDYLREHRDQVQLLEKDRRRLGESLSRYTSQVITFTDRGTELDRELQQAQSSKAIVKEQISTAFHLGRMVRAASE